MASGELMAEYVITARFVAILSREQMEDALAWTDQFSGWTFELEDVESINGYDTEPET